MDWTRVLMRRKPAEDGRGFSIEWTCLFRFVDSLATIADGIARLLLWVPFGWIPPSLSAAWVCWGSRLACKRWRTEREEAETDEP